MEQIVAVLKQAELGVPVAEVIRKVGISEQIFYRWKKQYVGMETDQARQLRQLQEENSRLKQLVADLSLDKTMLQDVLRKKLGEELRVHLAWRWFTGLGFDQEVPNHSTLSWNRHGRFQESKVFEQLSGEVVAQCLAVGLVPGDKLSVDGTFVEANASKESRIPREQLAETAQVNRTVREYSSKLERQNPVEEPTHSQDKVSTTDPDSTYATKGGTPARMGYYNNYLIDNYSCIVVGVQATGARLCEESRAAEDMITRFTH